MARGFREEKTKYPGVTFIQGKSKATGKPEKIFYITYYRQGKRYHEKAGREGVDGMTARLANNLRAARMEGRELPNRERRAEEARVKAEIEGRWTIEKLWREYLTHHPDLKGRGNDEYRYNNYLKATFGGKVPSDLVPMDVTRLSVFLGKRLAPQTVKNTLELLRRVINFGIKKNLIPALHFTIIMPKVNNEKTEDLTSEQLSRLVGVLKDENFHEATRHIMLIALLTGMRRGEIFSLKWSDLDFQRSFIRIRSPKGGTDQAIPMPSGVREIFQSKVRGKDNEYIFPGHKGKRRTSINNNVNAIKRAAGLPPGREFRGIHGLRHVFASMLASSGEVDLYTLQRLLTHKSPVMTQRYAHLRDETLKRASSIAGKIVSKA